MGLVYHTEDQIAFFIINNPSIANALDYASLTTFQESLEIFNDDPQIRVGIISASGEKAFCSGIDLKDTLGASSTPSLPPTLMRGIETTKPLIAAVNGAALGGGLELALACDIRIAAAHAVFGFPEVKLGLIPAWGGTQRLVRQLTWARASEMLFSGRSLSSQEAKDWGLINQVTSPHEIMSTARHWAQLVCQAAPLAVQAAKEAMQKGSRLLFEEGLQLEDALCAWLKTTHDFQEGLASFREHRTPFFTGQ